MSKTQKKAALPDVRRTAAVARKPTIASLLGTPILLDGESLERREGIAQSLREQIQPRDTLEEIYLDDLIEAQWEKLRCRRAKINILRSSAHTGVRKLIAPLIDTDPFSMPVDDPVASLVERWIRREPAALQEVRQLLEKAGHDNETIMAQTLIALIEKVEAIDKLISRAESRYNAAIRDINDHRAALAQRRHDAITDADYEELDNEENAA